MVSAEFGTLTVYPVISRLNHVFGPYGVLILKSQVNSSLDTMMGSV